MTPDWSATTVLVVGLGVSGAAAARALLRAGANVRVTDPATSEALADRAGELAAAGADVRLGQTGFDAAAVLAGCELVVTSPGVPQRSPVLAGALAAGLPVWSEPELAWRLAGDRTRLVGVTGTNGKTTSTQLLAACLDAPTGGNIGTPLTELVSAEAPPPVVVAELSSFQLRFTERLRTDVGVVLNVAPDHLDWHGSMAAYGEAKARVWANQRAAAGGGLDGMDWAVTNADDRGTRELVADFPPAAGVATFTLQSPAAGQVGVVDGTVVSRLHGAESSIVAVDRLQLPGPHNLANVCAVAAAAVCAGAAPEALAAPLASFGPGAHRLERVATVGAVGWVNDSKATNPHAAAAALATFTGNTVVWIAGGLNKGLAFDELAPLLAERVHAVVTIGSAGPTIAALARGLGITTVDAGELPAAVRAAAVLARPGDTVLLAPACASMDQFTNYAQRGEVFREAVAKLGTAAPPGAVGGRAPGRGGDRGQ